MKSKTVCKNGQHNGSKTQSPISKNRKNVHIQPTGQNQHTEMEGNTSSQPPNILLQETKAGSKTNKKGRPYLMEKEAETETCTIK